MRLISLKYYLRTKKQKVHEQDDSAKTFFGFTESAESTTTFQLSTNPTESTASIKRFLPLSFAAAV